MTFISSHLRNLWFFLSAFKDQFDRLDILVNNAGVSVTNWKTTKQGYELQFGVNHMGHTYLTLLLTPLLKKSKYLFAHFIISK